MAYNNFPVGYQPAQIYYPQQQSFIPQSTQQAPIQNPLQSGGIIWVQGESGAKSYLVAPNNTVQLWDSESPTIYLKSADASGMPSMKILEYKIRNSGQDNAVQAINRDNSNYVTLDEFNVIKSEIIALKGELSKIKEADGDAKQYKQPDAKA